MFEKAFVDLRVSLIQQEELTLTNGMLVAQMVKRLSAMQETWVRFLGWKDPLEKEMATHFVTSPGSGRSGKYRGGGSNLSGMHRMMNIITSNWHTMKHPEHTA